jgi:sugar lactone lactonase YvrE
LIYRRVRSLILILLAAAGLLGGAAYGQSTFRLGSQSLIVNDSTNADDAFEGIAIDTSGNLYVAGCGMTAVGVPNICKETLQPNGTYVETVPFTAAANGFQGAQYIAVDTAGNVYIADVYNERVLKETLSGGTYTQSIVTDFALGGLEFPNQIAVDSSGNVYITDPDNKRVLKETLSGGSYTQSIIGSGLSGPYGVAVDSSGNVYIADNYLEKLFKETLAGTTYTQSVIASYPTTIWAGNMENVAVDGLGNVYVSGENGNVGVATPISNGGYITANLLYANYAWGVAVDSHNNIYATNFSHQVTEWDLTPVSFSSVAVGSTGSAVTFPFYTPVAYNGVLPQEVVSAAAVSTGAFGEFTDTGAGTCDTNGSHSYAAGETCTVTVAFSPKAAGIRRGAVEIVNGTGVVLGTAYVSAVGTGPQVAFSSGPQTTVASGMVTPMGVAVNGSGVVYIADPGTHGYFYVATPSGSGYTQSEMLATLNGVGNGAPSEEAIPGGIATDGAGNLYFSSTLNDNFYGNYVDVDLYYNGANYNGQPLAYPAFGNGLTSPTGLAADPSGNIYIADTGNNRVVEELYIGGVTYDTNTPLQLVVASGLSNPQAVASDASGNIYIADTGNNRILMATPKGDGVFSVGSIIPPGLTSPAGVAVDDFGNIFISDTGNKRVLMEVPGNTGYIQTVIPVTGLVSPQGLAVDASENLFIADSGTGSVYKIALGTGPSLTFASTNVGSTSSDSPQTVTFSNIGNAALTFPIPTTGTNPSVSANFSVSSIGSTACPALTNSSGSNATLAAATSCTLPISFSPTTAGSISGTVKSTDNALNVSGTVQTINLSGTATSPSAPVASLSPTSIAFGDQTVSTSSVVSLITLSNTGNATLTGIAISITGANPTDFMQTNNCGTTLAASATCIIAVTFTPASVANFTASVSVANNATGSPQTVALTGTGTATPTPQAVLSSTSLSYGNQNTGTSSVAQTITLSNPGTASLSISSIVVTGASANSFSQTNTCGTSLAASASCIISVIFAPQATGAMAAAITVTDNATGSLQSAVLSGTGTVPPVPQAVLAPTSLTFASQLLNTTSTAQTITLSNPGTATLTISSIAVTGANSGAYAETTTCGTTLAASATCAISVTFTPLAAGPLAASLTVADNAAGAPQNVALTGGGINPATFTLAVTPAMQTINPGSAANFTINITSTGGTFTSGVMLTVTGLPTGATGTFSAASVTPGSSGGSSVLTVRSAAQYGSLIRHRNPTAPVLAVFLLSPAWLLLRRRRRFVGLSFAVLLLVTSLGLTSCAGGYFGPAPQSYTLTVTGTGSSIQQSTNITLNVQ